MQVIALIMLSTISIIWSLFFFPVKFVGLKIYRIKDRSIICLVSNKIKDKSIIVEDGENPCGFFLSWKYIGYVNNVPGQNGSESSEIYILTTKKTYDTLIKRDTVNNEPNKTVEYYYRSGNFFWLQYNKRDLCLNVTASNNQLKIINKIKDLYNESNSKSVVAYIHGKPGSGKSTVPILLAQAMNGSVCKTFNPTDPGDRLDNLYNTVNPTEVKPFILILEEVDNIIIKVHSNVVSNHKHIPVLINNKSSWNTLFDDLKLLYPFMIVIMTSNQSPTVIDSLDSSYLRKGRVDLRLELDA